MRLIPHATLVVVSTLLLGAAPQHPAACDLVSKREVEQLFGKVAGEPKGMPLLLCGNCSPSTAPSMCTFELAGTRKYRVEIHVAFAPFDSPDRPRMERERAMTHPHAHVRDVSGLGDAAHWTLGQSWSALSVYTANAHLHVGVHGIERDAAVARGEALARIALGRLR